MEVLSATVSKDWTLDRTQTIRHGNYLNEISYLAITTNTGKYEAKYDIKQPYCQTETKMEEIVDLVFNFVHPPP